MIEIKDKDNIKKYILLQLINKDTPITVRELADITSVSGKSIRTYLKELQWELKEKGIQIIKKPGVGVYLDLSNIDKEKLEKELKKGTFQKNSYSSEFRKLYILKTLFKNRYTYTIQLLADDLYCSKGTIVKDLNNVEKWLQKYELTLKRKQNQGLWIEGNENKCRMAVMDLFKKIDKSKETKLSTKYKKLDYRISDFNLNKIVNFFPNIDIYEIQQSIQEAEKKLGYHFTEEAFINLIIHIEIAIERIKNDKEIKMNEENFRDIKDKFEFYVAKSITEKLSEKFKISFPEHEIGYIVIHMLGAKVQHHSRVTDYEIIIKSQEDETIEIAKEIISLVGKILNVDLSNDKMLFSALLIHLKPTIVRLKHGLKLSNPILDRIKSEYTSIFGATWSCSAIFERKIGISINEDEVGYIAMHIAAAISRINNKIKAILVCSSGIGTSQLIAIKLKRAFENIEIISVIPFNVLSESMIEDADIIISTVVNFKNIPKIVCVSALLEDEDIEKIENFIYKLNRKKVINENNTICNFLDEDLCFIDNERTDFIKIINHYGKIMEKKGYVKEGFCEDVLRREDVGSTYIGEGVTIPHSLQKYVVKSKICIVKLKNTIVWKENKINLIIILAISIKDNNTTRNFFRSFYSILNNKNLLNKINQSNDKKIILNVFRDGGIEHE